MIVTPKITMDMARRGFPPVVDAVQGDKNSRAVEVALTNSGVPFYPPNDAFVFVRFRKPDETGGIYERLPDGSNAVAISGNVLTVNFVPQMLTAAGKVKVQIQFVRNDDEIATFDFVISVLADPSIGALESEDYLNISGFIANEIKNEVDNLGLEDVNQKIAELEKNVADLMYVPIAISEITNNAKTNEIGATLSSVSLSWSLNKEPVRQTLPGASLETDDRAATIPGPFTENKTFKLIVTDERGKTDQASTAIKFLNGVYYGVLKDGQPIDSDAILKLTRNLQASRGVTFTANAGAGYRHAFALPAEGYGTPTFKDSETGFQASFYLAETFEFTNRSGHTETYNVWLSTQVGLGVMTVVVS